MLYKMVYVPKASSGRFWRVPVYAGRFRKVGSGRSRKVLDSSGEFRRVGVGSGGRVRKVPETGVVCCLATLTGAAISHVIVLITGITLSNIVYMGKTTAQTGVHVVVYATAVGDTTKAYARWDITRLGLYWDTSCHQV